MSWLKNKLRLVLLISLVLNVLLLAAYLKDDCKNVIGELQQELQNVLAQNTNLAEVSDGLYQEFIRVSSEKENLITELENTRLDLISSQKLNVNYKDQLIESWVKADKIKAQADSNSIRLDWRYDKGYIHIIGNVDVFFSRDLNAEFVRKNILRSKVSAVLKQDPMQIITNLVKDEEGLKSYVKLNRVGEEGVVETTDWLEASETTFNPELFQCKADRHFVLGGGYSPVAGLLYLGLGKYRVGVISNFGDKQNSYMVMYEIKLKDFNGIGELLW